MKEYLEKESKYIKRKFFQKKLYAGIFILMGIAVITMAIKLEGLLSKLPMFLMGSALIIYGGHDLYNIIKDEKEFNEEQKKYEEGLIKEKLEESIIGQATDKPEEEKTELKIVKKRPTKKKKEKTQTL